MISERLKKIIEENKKFEKESPYNFCDRWCERCDSQRQNRCSLYQDEVERKITCIAHGRDEDDNEITEEVLKWQYEKDLENMEKFCEENEIDLDDLPDEEFAPIKNHMKFVENNPLLHTVKQYHKTAHQFLERYYYHSQEKTGPGVKDSFEVMSWYYTLLPVKAQRAMAGFHEEFAEGDFAFYDAVAQIEICTKAVNCSVEAIRNLRLRHPNEKQLLNELLALLHNIKSRFEAMIESI